MVHLWLGSGGCKGKHGVGILVHSRWKPLFIGFRALSERLGVGEFVVGKFKLMVVVVNMPHGGYDDDAVEALYLELFLIIKEERKSN